MRGQMQTPGGAGLGSYRPRAERHRAATTQDPPTSARIRVGASGESSHPDCPNRCMGSAITMRNSKRVLKRRIIEILSQVRSKPAPSIVVLLAPFRNESAACYCRIVPGFCTASSGKADESVAMIWISTLAQVLAVFMSRVGYHTEPLLSITTPLHNSPGDGPAVFLF